MNKLTLEQLLEQKTLSGILDEAEQALREKEREFELRIEKIAERLLGEAVAKIPRIQGDKGDSIKGDKPILGIDYKIPTPEEIAKNVKIPKPNDGKTPTKKELVQIIKPLIPKPVPGKDGEDGKDGVEIKPEEVVIKLESLKGNKRLDKSAIKGLDDDFASLRQEIKSRVGGGVSVDYVDLSSQLNGVTKTFVLPTHTKIFSVEGSSAPFGAFRPIVDFTETRTSITFTSVVDASVSLVASQSLIVWFLK